MNEITLLEAPERLDHLRNFFQRYAQDVNESLDFLEWYVKEKRDLGKPSISWEKEIYRIVYGNYDPLSVMGSIGKGGRFNIGGAQLNHFFPNFSMQATLYGASTRDCARKEVGEFLGKAQEYVIKPKKTLFLWNLLELVEIKLPYPGLKKLVDETPLAARWELQKVPKISQILAYFLRKQAGDGVIYPSTKDKKGNVIAFFATNDEKTKKVFEAKKL